MRTTDGIALIAIAGGLWANVFISSPIHRALASDDSGDNSRSQERRARIATPSFGGWKRKRAKFNFAPWRRNRRRSFILSRQGQSRERPSMMPSIRRGRLSTTRTCLTNSRRATRRCRMRSLPLSASRAQRQDHKRDAEGGGPIYFNYFRYPAPFGFQPIESAEAGPLLSASRYSIAPIVSRAIRARALICLFRASPSVVNSPCFMAFLFPLGAPPLAPCILQTLNPLTAGDRH